MFSDAENLAESGSGTIDLEHQTNKSAREEERTMGIKVIQSGNM